MRKPCACLIALLLAALCLAPAARAGTPYKTFTRNRDYDMVETQTAYEPVRTMIDFGGETLKNATDLRMGPDGNLYVCDDGNNRVLVITREGALVRQFGDKKTLKSVMGCYIAPNLHVYVADEKGRRVVEFDETGAVVGAFEKPTHPLFGEGAPFKPAKVVADKRGNLYVISTGNTNGIVQLSPAVPGGEFLGYFGANASNVSFLTEIKKALFSDEQLATMADIVPTSMSNLSIDQKGMIFTTTQTQSLTALRKLNVAGKNILSPDWYAPMANAVDTTASGSIFVADVSGWLLEYTSEGDILFIFGTFDNGQQRAGMFQHISGLVADDDYTLYVLDKKLNTIQVFRPTEFTQLVHSAFELFQDGKYAESKQPWSEVLRMNSLFTYASVGLGEALYREGDFRGALECFRNGGFMTGYSDAFWEVRSDWLHDWLGVGLMALAGLIALSVALKLVNRRTRALAPVGRALRAVGGVPIVRRTGYCFYMIRNPYDCCYGIKHEGKASWLSAAAVLLIYFVLYVLTKYFSGFLYRAVPDGYFDVAGDFLTVAGAFMLLVGCCYLVCTVKEGEARLRDLFIGLSYCLAPMIVCKPAALLLSNVLTLNESVFITLVNVLSCAGTGVLVVLCVMYMNDYGLGKALKVLFLTLFTALVLIALAFVLYVLFSQLVDFVASIYGEVVYRFVKA